jgi:hypothetical protein
VSDAEMDFHTYVGAHYELRLAAELLIESEDQHALEKQFRYLVQVGRPKMVRPRRKALDFAVGLFLRFPERPTNPKAEFAPPGADEILRMERNVLAIAKQLGLLRTALTPDRSYGESRENQHESLYKWLRFGWWIQSIFAGKLPAEFPIATLDVFLASKPGGSKIIAVRPVLTSEALAFHAAQMIAKGTTSQICEHCGTTFLSGGRGAEKKRGGSRFCSDECRWKYHNESRRKAR